MSLENKLADLEKTFQSYTDWEDRYKHIIDMGKNLEPMPTEFKTEDNKVKGCQSQVWLFAQEGPGKTVQYFADSDASIAKGIIALLLEIYSGQTPETIMSMKDDFIDQLGLRQHLSMNRANGLNAMIKQIQMYAIAFQAKFQAGL